MHNSTIIILLASWDPCGHLIEGTGGFKSRPNIRYCQHTSCIFIAICPGFIFVGLVHKFCSIIKSIYCVSKPTYVVSQFNFKLISVEQKLITQWSLITKAADDRHSFWMAGGCKILTTTTTKMTPTSHSNT